MSRSRFPLPHQHPTSFLAFLGILVALAAGSAVAGDDHPASEHDKGGSLYLDNTTIRDRDGRRVGHVESRPYGGAIYGKDGTRQGWIEDRPYGAAVYGPDGRRVGTIERRW